MPEDALPPVRQRIGAYALLLREGAVLLTQMSARTRIEGRWTLPGGGIDHGEDPRLAVVREVYEETGLHIDAGRVLDVHSIHFVGPRSDGVVEDYHGVHIIYAGQVRAESAATAPYVVEDDSSTAVSAWVPVAEALERPLLSAAQFALDHLLARVEDAGR